MPTRGERPRLVIVMGVAGAGKTTIGSRLAARLGLPYADADEMHSSDAIMKMNSGTPLSDADREPWLTAVGQWLRRNCDLGGVVACSALKRRYRDTLRGYADVWFLHLAGDREIVRARVASRPGHFMPASLVASQYAELEPLAPDELGETFDLAGKPELIVESFLRNSTPATRTPVTEEQA